MPPRKKKQPDTPPEASPEEQHAMQGAPQHGDEYQGPSDDNQGGGEQQLPLSLDEERQGDPLVQQLMARIDEQGQLLTQQSQMLQQLRRQIPPDQPPQQREEETPPNFEQLLFEDPNKALQMHGEIVARRVRDELTQMYQREQGTKNFWDQFFTANPDLQNDRDLVEVTLNSNLSDMAELPVAEAITRLADLTRQRILRYAGKEKGSTKRPVVEGASAPLPRQTQQEEPEVSTLSDLIKARNMRRTQKATAA